MKRLYFNIDKENNKVILDRKDFDYLMSIGHYNDKAIEYVEKEFQEVGCCVDGSDLPYSYISELLDILRGSEPDDNNCNNN
jgi:hypothetical protein